jgi:Secretion system C-terminal sorting domain
MRFLSEFFVSSCCGSSQHRSIAASQHRSIAASQHRSIAASQHRSIAASQLLAFLLFFMVSTLNAQTVICSTNAYKATFTQSSTNSCVYTFKVTGEIANILWSFNSNTDTNWFLNNQSGGTVEVTFPSSGTYTVTLNAQPNVNCVATFVVLGCGVPPAVCDFDGSFNVDCSRLRVNFSPNGVANQPGNQIAFSIASINALNPILNGQPGGFGFDLFNVNTCATPNLTVTMTVTNPQGQVCSVTKVIPIPAQFQGIYIGKDCEVTNLTTLNVAGFFPGSTFNGSLTNQCLFVYLSGILNVNKTFTFNRTRIYTGQSAGVNVGTPGITKTLSLNNGTTIEPMPTCLCMWRGINVNSRGWLNVNSVPTLARVQIRQAMFAIRTLRGFSGSAAPVLNLNSLDLDRNFIGIRCTDGQFNLLRLSGVNFSANPSGIGKYRCWSCPMIINDLQDSDGPKGPEFVNCTFVDDVFTGSFAPTHSANGSCNAQGAWTGSFTVPNGNEFDFPITTNPANGEPISYAGIFIDGIRQAGFGASGANNFRLTPTQAPVVNNFTNLQSGIVLLGANGNITRSSSFNNTTDQWYANNSGDCVLFLSDNGAHNLIVDGNTFNQSVRGVYAAPYFSPGPGTITVRNTVMTNMQQGVAVVNDVQVPFTGNFAQVEIGPNNTITANQLVTMLNPLPKSDIYGVYVGDVAAEPTRINIHDNTINIDFDAGPTFSNVMGIWGQGWQNNSTALLNDQDDVDNNTVNMLRSRFGIRLIDCLSSRVTSNSVVNSRPVGLNYDKLISLEGGGRANVNCNNLTASLNHSNQSNSYMDGLFSSFHRDGSYTHNGITKATRSATFYGLCGIASRIAQNDFRGPAQIGVLYAGTVPDPAGPLVPTTTGPQFCNVNEWYGTFKNKKAYGVAGTDYPGSKWTVANCFSCPQGPLDTEVEPQFNWFYKTCAVQPPVAGACPQSDDQLIQPIVTIRDIQNVNQKQVSTGLYFDKLDLLSRLRLDPSLANQDVDLAQFFQNAQVGNLGAFLSGFDALRAYSSQNHGLLGQIKTLHAQESNLLAQLEGLHQLLASDPDNASNQSELAQLELLIKAIETEKSVINAQYALGLKSIAVNQFDVINNIVPTEAAEDHLKKAFGLYFGSIAGIHQPDLAELGWLADVTRGCPEETGPAYYVADHVHTLAAGYSVMGQNCKIGMITEERSSASKALTSTDVFVYPNPTTGNDVQIEAGFPIASIRLVNSLGQQVAFRRFSELSTQVNTEFDTPNGIYLLEVAGSNQQSAHATILIQK